MWRNFEQALRLIERGEIAIGQIVDDSFIADDPVTAFDAFLASETCKPVFSFGDLRSGLALWQRMPIVAYCLRG